MSIHSFSHSFIWVVRSILFDPGIMRDSKMNQHPSFKELSMMEIILRCDRLYKRGLYRIVMEIPKRYPPQPGSGRGECQKMLARDGHTCLYLKGMH